MYLRRKIGMVWIVLGDACNCQCRYCIQHGMQKEEVLIPYNPEICNFIEEVIAERNSEAKLKIYFTGGEPLLYFESLRKFILDMQYLAEKLEFTVITNGRALDYDKVKFFNEHNIRVQVSWDGPNSAFARGYDVVMDKKYRLLECRRLSMHATLSDAAYPLEVLDAMQSLDDEYFLLWNHHMASGICPLKDNGSGDAVFNYDLGRLYSEMKLIVYNYYNNEAFRERYVVAKDWMDKLMAEYISVAAAGDKITIENRNCIDGIRNYCLDREGNLYPCHSMRNAAGTIHTPYFEYIQNIKASEKEWFDKSTCDKCVVKFICRGGCKLTKKEQQKHYCEATIAAYKGFTEFMLEPQKEFYKLEVK